VRAVRTGFTDHAPVGLRARLTRVPTIKLALFVVSGCSSHRLADRRDILFSGRGAGGLRLPPPARLRSTQSRRRPAGSL